MQLQTFVFLFQYVLFYNIIFFNVPSVSSLAGKNIRDARVNEFPFIAGIIRRSRQFIASRDMICTGSLISEQDVLTASHCLECEDKTGVKIAVGSIELSINTYYYPAYWIIYDEWAILKDVMNQFNSNDLMIIRLSRKIVNAPVVQLAYPSYKELKGKPIFTMGWGEIGNDTFPRLLQVAELKVIGKSECLKKSLRLSGVQYSMDRNVVCSRARPFIILVGGDSGGPVLFNNKLIAINTATMPLPDQKFHPEKNNIHTLLRYYKTFIKNTLSE